jgi:hypothetical protein
MQLTCSAFHTHNFDNHSNGYSCSKTAVVQSVSRSPEIRFVDRFSNSETVLKHGEDYDF